MGTGSFDTMIFWNSPESPNQRDGKQPLWFINSSLNLKPPKPRYIKFPLKNIATDSKMFSQVVVWDLSDTHRLNLKPPHHFWILNSWSFPPKEPIQPIPFPQGFFCGDDYDSRSVSSSTEKKTYIIDGTVFFEQQKIEFSIIFCWVCR